MRRVTQNSVNAFMRDQNYAEGNTTVRTAVESGGGEYYTEMYLHGNRIARKLMNQEAGIQITNCGYSTNVTKERLNGLPGVNIVQKNCEWYLNGKEWNGELIEV